MTRLSDAALRRISGVAWWFFAATIVGRILVEVLDQRVWDLARTAEGISFLVVMSMFPLTGRVILTRQPRNGIGWLLSFIGVVWGIGGASDTYAVHGLRGDQELAGATFAATIANGIWAPALGLTGTFLFLLFPDGHLPGPRWRWLAWLSGVVLATLTVSLYVSPDPLVEGPGVGLSNPLGVEALGPAVRAVQSVLIPLFAACIFASALSLVVRFRRARGIEREQLKWLTTAAAVVGGVFVVGIVASFWVPEDAEQPAWQAVMDQLSFLLFALLPVAIGVAVLRYRLYDIDRVINRALVYVALTACLLAVYLGSVLTLQSVLRPLTQRSDLAVAASTLAVAALFGPARRRIQVAVDRRFYRHRYDAARTVSDFSARLRQEIDLDAIGTDLVRIAGDAVQPTDASLWLRPVTVPGRTGPRKDSP